MEGQPRREDNHDGTTTSGTPNHTCEQLLAGWKRGNDNDNGTMTMTDNDDNGTTMTTTGG